MSKLVPKPKKPVYCFSDGTLLEHYIFPRPPVRALINFEHSKGPQPCSVIKCNADEVHYLYFDNDESTPQLHKLQNVTVEILPGTEAVVHSDLDWGYPFQPIPEGTKLWLGQDSKHKLNSHLITSNMMTSNMMLGVQQQKNKFVTVELCKLVCELPYGTYVNFHSNLPEDKMKNLQVPTEGFKVEIRFNYYK